MVLTEGSGGLVTTPEGDDGEENVRVSFGGESETFEGGIFGGGAVGYDDLIEGSEDGRTPGSDNDETQDFDTTDPSGGGGGGDVGGDDFPILDGGGGGSTVIPLPTGAGGMAVNSQMLVIGAVVLAVVLAVGVSD